uniref:Uncharacterized protein n=1 Tax=Oryza barthii TaxID=65489 RepID=A0A0D3H554_9ORYZ
MVITGGAASGATVTPTADPVSAASVAGGLAPATDLAADPVATVAGGVASATDPTTDQEATVSALGRAVLVDGSMMVCAILGMFLDLWWCGCNEERLDVSA